MATLIKEKKNLSIKWKIFIYLISFCILLLIILWLFQTVFLDAFYQEIKKQEIKGEAADYAALIEAGDYDTLRERVTQRGDLFVEIWSHETGSALFSGNMPMDLPTQHLQEDRLLLYQETLANGGSLSSTETTRPFADKRGRESITYTAILPSTSALLIVSANITPVDATIGTLRIQLLFVSAIMLLLATLIALLISKRVSTPIEKLNEGAKKLGRGKIDFHTEGYKEIVELSDTLEQAAQALLKTDRLRQELIANVSHDLRTPLTLITGYGELIRDLPDENTTENMQVIIDESKRLTSLVNNLLDLSRLQAGVQDMHIMEFSLTDETRKIISRFAKFCEQEGYRITFDFDREATVSADPERIAQVIYNFISNAITHAGEDRRISLRQTIDASRVALAVTDTGEGIREDRLDEIWERYYKIDQVHKRAAIGTGLGLSIVKSILEQLPGVEYGVKSELGHGSTFWFSLPLVK